MAHTQANTASFESFHPRQWEGEAAEQGKAKQPFVFGIYNV